MHEAFIDINNIPTKVVTWGKWIEENLNDMKELIIFIPGNPGLPRFYEEFLNTIYEHFNGQISIWAIGHSGHEKPPRSANRTMPSLKSHSELYTLNGQIEHKIEFLKKYVPKDVKLYFVGHSIGAYIILDILKRMPHINQQTNKSFLLFPAIERMASTTHGMFLHYFVRYIIWLILFGCYLFVILPKFIQTILLGIYMLVTRMPLSRMYLCESFLKPNVVEQVLFMVMDEMNEVKERDDQVIVKNLDRLRFVYSTHDKWAPVDYYHSIKRTHEQIDAQLTQYDHAFVVTQSQQLATIVNGWIEQQHR